MVPLQVVELLSKPKEQLPKSWPVRLGPPIINLDRVDHGVFARELCECTLRDAHNMAGLSDFAR